MKVYILYTTDVCGFDSVEGVFASYSAMTTWLKEKYNYSSDLCKQDDTEGCFSALLYVKGDVYDVGYYVFDVIGEHSHKTNTIEFK
jgi:hypothetical protein